MRVKSDKEMVFYIIQKKKKTKARANDLKNSEIDHNVLLLGQCVLERKWRKRGSSDVLEKKKDYMI